MIPQDSIHKYPTHFTFNNTRLLAMMGVCMVMMVCAKVWTDEEVKGFHTNVLAKGGFILKDTRQCTSTVSCAKRSHGPTLTCISALFAWCLFGDKEMSLYSNNLWYVAQVTGRDSPISPTRDTLFPSLNSLCKKGAIESSNITQDYLLKLVHCIHPLSILLSNHSTRFIFRWIRYKIGLWWERCWFVSYLLLGKFSE